MEFDLLVAGELNADVIVECGDVRPTFRAGRGDRGGCRDRPRQLRRDHRLRGGPARRPRLPWPGWSATTGSGTSCSTGWPSAGSTLPTACARPGRRTGMTVVLGARGDRSMLTFPGEIGRLAAADIPAEALAAARHLHVSSYFLQYDLWEGRLALLKEFAGRRRSTPTGTLPLLRPRAARAAALPGLPAPERAGGRAPRARQRRPADLRPGGETRRRRRDPQPAGRHRAQRGRPRDHPGRHDRRGRLLRRRFPGHPRPRRHLRRRAARRLGLRRLSTQGMGGTAAQPTLPEALELAGTLTVHDLTGHDPQETQK